MSGDKLNTAEHDSKGRCIRHPDIRLRKKKLLGGWKILIGHCPECCLDEMRRVRDEIEGGDKKKKKKSKKRDKKRIDRKDSNEENVSRDGISLMSEGYEHNVAPRRPRRHREDGESEATGSTAQMSGGGSVVSEQYYRDGGPTSPGHHGGHHHHHSSETFRGYSHHHQSYQPQVHHTPEKSMAYQPQAQERTMVLSMPFIDPQTGHRGTYTGQVNSINHKPDGKGTVYYDNGIIAEGSWSNGILADGSDDEDDQGYNGRSRPHSRGSTRGSSRSTSRSSRIPDQESGYGNLHLLNALPGSKSRARGGSASVQSYNSRNSHEHTSGSASVQAGYSGDGGIYGGGNMGGYHPPARGRRNGGGRPMMNHRGEYEP